MSRAPALVATLLAAACGGASGDSGTEDGNGCAPRAARVDLAAPTFSQDPQVLDAVGFEAGRDLIRARLVLLPFAQGRIRDVSIITRR